MIGDRLVIKPEHYEKAEFIFKEVLERYDDNKMVICIGGESGTGKTEIASILQADLFEQRNLRCYMISLDDYYTTDWQNRNDIREEEGIDSVGLDEIDWDLVDETVDTFRSEDEELNLQKIHRYTNAMEYCITDNTCIDILIIEGLYANEISDKDLGVFLAGTYKETGEFRKERMKEPWTAFRKEVLKKEHEAVLKTRETADFIIER